MTTVGAPMETGDDQNQLVDPNLKPPSRLRMSTSTLGSNRPIDWWRVLIQPSLVEFVATTLFIFVSTSSALQTGSQSSNAPVINVAFATGIIVASLISALGPISGCHINPAITLGAFCSGLTAPGVAVAYIVSQLTGGVVGAALTRAVVSMESADSAANSTHWPLTLNHESINASQTLGMEIILTFTLMLIILMTDAESDSTNAMAPLIIGLTVTAAILAGGNKSGASMNPARSFGPAVAFGIYSNLYIYFIGPPIGAVMASLLYRFALTKKKLPVPFYSSFSRSTA